MGDPVTVTDVSKTYRLGKLTVTALAGVSLRVTAGEFLAVAGPSGSGKTTLLNLIGYLAGLTFVVNANRGDYRASPRLDYLVTGVLTVSVGADVFEGARPTLYGRFDRNVWLTTTWRF